MKAAYYQQVLYDELARRCKRNPRYSLRAFAQSLGVDVGNLSRALRGKTTLSPAYAKKIIENMALPPNEAKRFLESIKATKAKNIAPPARRQKAIVDDFSLIDQTNFEVIADLLHYAILELTATRGFKPDKVWIAKALGAPLVSVDLAVKRLMDLGFLKETRGKWRKCAPKIKTRPGITSAALRLHQKQVLTRACEAVEDVSLEQRCNVALTMPIDPEKMIIARRCIEEFSNHLCELLTSDARLQVYQLAIAFYPLQKEDTV